MSSHSNPCFTLGFSFVYFVNERDARDAICYLDSTLFGHTKRRLYIEWEKRLTKTLFVINFDPADTRIRDIERHFEPFGNVLHVRIRRNFAFVQFDTQEHATKALKCTHMRSPVLRRCRPCPDYGRAHSPVYNDRYIGAYYMDRSPDYGRYPRRILSCSRSRSPVCR
ncbi:hypothetical protein MKX03_032093 [Papaver bracteatum]|nr:hypothetical protein MKX03_032093 [Papaver bracteatum]